MLTVHPDKIRTKKLLVISAGYVLLFITCWYIITFLTGQDFDSIPIGYLAGISLAAILIGGRVMVPAIVLAVFLSSVFMNMHYDITRNILISGIITLTTYLQVTAGYKLFEHYRCPFDFLKSIRATFLFFSITIIISLFSACSGILIQFFLIDLNMVKLLNLFLNYWLKDITGILILVPLAISSYKNYNFDINLARLFEIISIFTLSFLFLQIVFGKWFLSDINNTLPFIIIPLLLWISISLTSRETSFALFLLSGIVLGAKITEFNLFQEEGISDISLQLYLIITSFTVIVLSVSGNEQRHVKKQLAEISQSLEKRVAKRTDELATLNKELLVEVNQRKKAEADLKESQERNQALLSSLPDMIFLHDKDGRFLDYQVPDPGRLFMSPHEFLGKKVDQVLPETVAKDFKKVFNRVLKTGVTQNYEYSLQLNGHEDFFEARISICGEDRVMSVIRDISDRRKAEQERQQLEDQVRHAQKLESLGILAGGIAHDFNNLLTAIMGNTSLAMLNTEDQKTNKNLQNIEKASLRAADLCSQLLAYSGKGKFVVDAININDLVNEMSKLLYVSISKKVRIEYNFADQIKLFEADPTQIRQIVMNLITNASEAIGDKNGKIQISTGTESCSREYLKNTFFDDNLNEGDYVFIEVSDNGSGMNEETILKIFDPFFTTKFTGRGLGLAAVIGIVRGHKGAIVIKSQKSKGTRFKIYFPVSTITQRELKTNDPHLLDWKGKGTVLVVDDDHFIRSLGKITLEQAGLEVITAIDGKDAVNIYKKNYGHINLVLMDMTMPKLNGEEAFKKMQEINSDVKVILSSGYSEQEATKKFNNSGLRGFLQKPYKPTDLLIKVKDLI